MKTPAAQRAVYSPRERPEAIVIVIVIVIAIVIAIVIVKVIVIVLSEGEA